MKLLWFILCATLQLSMQRSTPADDHYIGAVVEYLVDRDVDANKVKYPQLVREAAEQNADIVVFPELTLTNNTVAVPVPFHSLLKEYPIPALYPEHYHELLVVMSAAARNNGIYVVINVQELLDCTRDAGETCPEAKEYLFNTNVVFDRTGAVIDRYRKINLFGEIGRTPALQPDLGIFTTDFGVTFGHFICFDLMFQVPAVQVVQKHNIKDVIFPTMWFSELPYLTAVQIQEAYAYSLDVNFLGAGANRVSVGSAGSGIYSGKAGALISIMPGVPTTKLLVAKVPKVPGQVTEPVPGPIYDNPSDHDGLTLIVDPSLPSHVSRVLVEGAQEFTLVDKDVSCTFKVKLARREGDVDVHYRAFVQDGSHTYARREVGNTLCVVAACKSDDIKSCGYKFNKSEERVIETLELRMTTYPSNYNRSLHCDNVEHFPVSLQNNKFPLNPKNYTYTKQEENTCKSQNDISVLQKEINKNRREVIQNKINVPQSGLVTFGIWGRMYARDVDHTAEVTEEDKKKYISLMDLIYGTEMDNEIK